MRDWGLNNQRADREHSRLGHWGNECHRVHYAHCSLRMFLEEETVSKHALSKSSTFKDLEICPIGSKYPVKIPKQFTTNKKPLET